jgi:hypothetical protein
VLGNGPCDQAGSVAGVPSPKGGTNVAKATCGWKHRLLFGRTFPGYRRRASNEIVMVTFACPTSSHTSLKNHQPATFLKHDQTSFGGQPDNPSGSTFAAGAVAALDELTKRQHCLSLLDFHSMKIKRLDAPPLSGISPMPEFIKLAR